MQFVIDRAGFEDVSLRHVNDDLTVRAERRLAVGGWQRRAVARVSQCHTTTYGNGCVLAVITLQSAAVSRFGVNVKVLATVTVCGRWHEPLRAPDQISVRIRRRTRSKGEIVDSHLDSITRRHR